MNNQREKSVMNFNRSMQFSTPAPRPDLQLHNFMSIPASDLHADHLQRENDKKSSFRDELEQQMKGFWKERMSEVCNNPTDVRGAHTLPLARIKKVMKSDEQVKMISADTPVVFAKACEMFIMELSQRAWIHTQLKKRRTLQRNDVANAIRDEDLLAFLQDVVPMETTYTQEEPLSLDDHPGVYVPAPIRRNHADQYPTMNQSGVAREAHPTAAANNHGFTFPMNFDYNFNNDFMQ